MKKRQTRSWSGIKIELYLLCNFTIKKWGNLSFLSSQFPFLSNGKFTCLKFTLEGYIFCEKCRQLLVLWISLALKRKHKSLTPCFKNNKGPKLVNLNAYWHLKKRNRHWTQNNRTFRLLFRIFKYLATGRIAEGNRKQLPKALKVCIPFDSAILFLEIYPKEIIR